MLLLIFFSQLVIVASNIKLIYNRYVIEQHILFTKLVETRPPTSTTPAKSVQTVRRTKRVSIIGL